MALVMVVALAVPLLCDRQLLQAAPRQVLYLTQSAAFAHAVLDHSEEVLGRIGAESGAFDVTVSHDASTLTAATLDRYDAVVFYTTGELPMRRDQKAALLAYVRGGGGFVGVHSATDTFYGWPDYGALIGGYFDGHPWRQEVAVRGRGPDTSVHAPPRGVIQDRRRDLPVSAMVA